MKISYRSLFKTLEMVTYNNKPKKKEKKKRKAGKCFLMKSYTIPLKCFIK